MRDFGLLDRLYVARENREGKAPRIVKHYSSKSLDSDEHWVCFVPEGPFWSRVVRGKIFDLLPEIDIYLISEKAVQSDPRETRKYLDRVLGAAYSEQARRTSGELLNVIGMSIGNVLAYNFARQFPTTNLVSVVPGARLADCIFESRATRDIPNRGNFDLEDYRRELREFNPIEALEGMLVDKLNLFYGTSDLMIPSSSGRELAEAVRNRRNLKSEIIKYLGCGHVMSVLKFAQDFKKKLGNS